MESKKRGLTVILVVVTAVLCLLVGYLFGSKINIQNTDEKENNNEVIDKVDTNNEVIDKDDTNNEHDDDKSVCEVGTIKNIRDVFTDKDTNAQKAQKIAKEVMDAVNNKDWYYLAKMVGTDADDFINYGIYNYSIDVNNYNDREGVSFVFAATYDWDKTKLNNREDIALGTLLVITFEDDGAIRIEPNCTGA